MRHAAGRRHRLPLQRLQAGRVTPGTQTSISAEGAARRLHVQSGCTSGCRPSRRACCAWLRPTRSHFPRCKVGSRYGNYGPPHFFWTDDGLLFALRKLSPHIARRPEFRTFSPQRSVPWRAFRTFCARRARCSDGLERFAHHPRRVLDRLHFSVGQRLRPDLHRLAFGHIAETPVQADRRIVGLLHRERRPLDPSLAQ